MIIIINAINFFFQVLIYLIIGRAILSWFVRNPYDTLGKIYSMILQITEPIIAPCRMLLSRFNLMGTMDFSPVLALIGLSIINRIIVSVLLMFSF